MSILLHPHRYDPTQFDAETRRMLTATVEWFEQRGLRKLLDDFHNKTYYTEFLEFLANEKVIATFLTPTQNADGDPEKRWDSARISALSEITGFYGLNYWYPYQVTILGLGPVWQSENAAARKRAAAALEAGGVGAFGLSEQTHGADIYQTDMILTPDGKGGWRASGAKYYIGNGNCATTVSVFGRVEGKSGPDQYVFFYADATHPNFHVIRNVVPKQMYVATFRLDDYPVRPEDILHTGEAAFSAALNTVNIGKFNLAFGSIGCATHALYDSITHSHNRILYGKPVTAMPHIRRDFVDAYVRLIAMKLYAYRALDYFRTATLDDRRYLLFNPMGKMKVTAEGERVVGLLGDIVSARGFEADSFIYIAKEDIPMLPRLEGTVAVNLRLALKAMPNYLFNPKEYPPVPTRTDPVNDDFLFHQGPAHGLEKIRYHDWRPPYDAAAHLPNVARFREQAEAFVKFLSTSKRDLSKTPFDFQLALGNLFILIPWGQLILEQATILKVDESIVDTIFDVLVRDFSQNAVQLHGCPASTEEERAWALGVVRAPVNDPERFDKVWEQVAALSGTYTMNPGVPQDATKPSLVNA
jgi:acyl-CoA dehydrogenase